MTYIQADRNRNLYQIPIFYGSQLKTKKGIVQNS